jgi:enamine deaminase RidA (YjgF/YER057c/UK114 family)
MQKVKTVVVFLVLCLSLGISQTNAQKVEMIGAESSIISSAAIVPEGKKLYFSSGLTASALNSSLPEGDYAKYGDTKAQAISILEKFKTTLAEKGLKMSDVFSMRVYLTPDVKTGAYDFDGWNAAYKQYFGTPENPNKPVRATLGVSALVNRFKFIEIEIVAAYP